MATFRLLALPLIACLWALGDSEKGLQWRIPLQMLDSIPFKPLEVDAGVQTVYL